MEPHQDREFDVILWGASGYTGQLVAEYLQRQYGTTSLRWALAGRNETKLAALRDRLDAPSLPLLLGDAHDRSAMAALAQRTRVMCSTVGPYARYGSALVAACAAAGTDYCDLAGEVTWIRRMHDAHQHTAERTGARLVTCCGFDSVPSDLGVFFLQREAQNRYGAPSPSIKGGVVSLSGGVSGGTVASMLDLLETLPADASARRILTDPYALNPEGERSGPPAADRFVPHHDAVLGQWTAPFVMAVIDSRVVRRSVAQLGDVYGRDMRYQEAMLMGGGVVGAAKAYGFAAGLAVVVGALAVGPLRRLIARWLPQPGEGPSAEQRRRGHWELRFYAAAPDVPGAAPLSARVRGDRDPGYGSTARMLAESAVCLAQDPLELPGGFHTPAAAMGAALLRRLQRRAGVSFEMI